MDLLEFILLTFQLTSVISKKYVSSSDESIEENLLYFKDCQHKPAHDITPLLGPQKLAYNQHSTEPECRFPRMCCSLTCDNECNGQQSFSTRQANFGNMQIQVPKPLLSKKPQLPSQPGIHNERKKKADARAKMQPPIGGRRDFGFSKDKIKGLISNDDDIRKILKDLVRVTMQKVDLQEVINARRNGNLMSQISKNSNDYIE